MGAELLVFAAGAVILIVLGSRGDGARRSTAAELASAHTVAAARLRIYEQEREERFRYYHQAWSRPPAPARIGRGAGYVLPFRAVGQ